jgi:acetolactate synthase small subunit
LNGDDAQVEQARRQLEDLVNIYLKFRKKEDG